jgi:hypothetical protein
LPDLGRLVADISRAVVSETFEYLSAFYTSSSAYGIQSSMVVMISTTLAEARAVKRDQKIKEEGEKSGRLTQRRVKKATDY